MEVELWGRGWDVRQQGCVGWHYMVSASAARPWRTNIASPLLSYSCHMYAHVLCCYDCLLHGADKEAWAKLFSLIASGEHATLAMALMLRDVGVRDENNWDWQTQGYGQTVFQLVQVRGGGTGRRCSSWCR